MHARPPLRRSAPPRSPPRHAAARAGARPSIGGRAPVPPPHLWCHGPTATARARVAIRRGAAFPSAVGGHAPRGGGEGGGGTSSSRAFGGKGGGWAGGATAFRPSAPTPPAAPTPTRAPQPPPRKHGGGQPASLAHGGGRARERGAAASVRDSVGNPRVGTGKGGAVSAALPTHPPPSAPATSGSLPPPPEATSGWGSHRIAAIPAAPRQRGHWAPRRGHATRRPRRLSSPRHVRFGVGCRGAAGDGVWGWLAGPAAAAAGPPDEVAAARWG